MKRLLLLLTMFAGLATAQERETRPEGPPRQEIRERVQKIRERVQALREQGGEWRQMRERLQRESGGQRGPGARMPGRPGRGPAGMRGPVGGRGQRPDARPDAGGPPPELLERLRQAEQRIAELRQRLEQRAGERSGPRGHGEGARGPRGEGRRPGRGERSTPPSRHRGERGGRGEGRGERRGEGRRRQGGRGGEAVGA